MHVRDAVDCAILLHEVLPGVTGCTVLPANLKNVDRLACKLEEDVHHFACKPEVRASFYMQTWITCIILRADFDDVQRFACRLR